MLTLMNSKSLPTRVHHLRLPPAIMGRWMVGTICWSSRSLWFRLGSQPGCCRSQMDTCQEVVDWPLLPQTNFWDPSSYCWYVLSLVRWCLLLVRVYQQSCAFTHLGLGFKTQAHSCREAGCLRMFANVKKSCLCCPRICIRLFESEKLMWSMFMLFCLCIGSTWIINHRGGFGLDVCDDGRCVEASDLQTSWSLGLARLVGNR